ncbi:MAG: flagellar basal body rod protein FlgB [Alphaproteobacteria bacterium]|nr:MAG: flagellar basal body rod protein FlgB [Alphaproteobacteria bacterium]
MNGPDFLDRQLGQPAAALRLRAQRLDLIASNIANAATPGYKARDLDFKAALAEAGAAGVTGQFGATQAIRYRVPVQASLDGNTVELATEQTAFAENAIDYRASLSFLSGRIQTLMAALKGGE